ncbi:MAG TPA: DNA gyrase inhibitor YacG [Candidatus Sulfotelmatobacter sp.]|nr:DNA gyrase inhibitor YacG [Candidatus Sulfotelmatobacter sp.]
MSKSSVCPICGKPAQEKLRPFCSRRCADVDLGRWLGEVYVVPGDETQPVAGTGLSGTDDEE